MRPYRRTKLVEGLLELLETAWHGGGVGVEAEDLWLVLFRADGFWRRELPLCHAPRIAILVDIVAIRVDCSGMASRLQVKHAVLRKMEIDGILLTLITLCRLLMM